MNKKITEKEWLEDFKDFAACENVIVPEALSNRILLKIKKDLNPSAWLVFAKILAIHSVVGTLSLGICNQFGMNPFNTDISLMNYFMKYGHTVCMTLCGALFISLSIGFALMLLNKNEILVFKKNSFIQVFCISLLSLATFLILGEEITLSIGVMWLLGGIVGGLLPSFLFIHYRSEQATKNYL